MPKETTSLTPQEELQFQGWARSNNIGNVDDQRNHYDMRGYWKNVVTRGGNQTKQYADGLHFPDTYKQHGHPTFSVESQYSAGTGDGGRWQGEQFIPAGADLLINSRGQQKMSDKQALSLAIIAMMKGS